MKKVSLNTLYSQQEISHNRVAVSFRVFSTFALRSIATSPSIAININDPRMEGGGVREIICSVEYFNILCKVIILHLYFF